MTSRGQIRTFVLVKLHYKVRLKSIESIDYNKSMSH